MTSADPDPDSPSDADADRDPLAAFDDAVFAAVARDRDRLPADLRDLAVRHQRSVRDLPGVDDLVYEYRKAFARGPVADRRAEAYYLLVPDHVWPEFGAALSVSDADLAALRALHDRQFRAALGGLDSDTDSSSDADADSDSGLDFDGDGDGDRDPLVLVRS